MNRGRAVETTLGNLIVALTEETSAYVRDEQAYQVVAFMLTYLLNNGVAIRNSRHDN